MVPILSVVFAMHHKVMSHDQLQFSSAKQLNDIAVVKMATHSCVHSSI